MRMQFLNDLFYLDEDEGVVRWKGGHKGVKAGQVAGGFVNGVYYITCRFRRFRAADVAWFLAHQKWPASNAWPKDGNKTNLRPDNLTLKRPRPTRRHRAVQLEDRGGEYRVSMSGQEVGLYDSLDKALAVARALVLY